MMKLQKKTLQRQEFEPGGCTPEFYAVMGPFFAEKKYRRELPWLINTPKKGWTLFFTEGKLAAFYGHEEKGDYTQISGFYVLSEWRGRGIGTAMLTDILERFPAVRITTNNPLLLSMLQENAFSRVSQRGSYLTLEVRKRDEGMWQREAGSMGADGNGN